eukprot:TRINITY_DN4009_c0_g1_i2.p1 TRINITY_DN4009_c0_g1~~TRINITY_DN4009_c0_g1_i2.p1  ORF type:complete len:239 (-),score=43.66 TRINITY_DN4009_c0_g1_i2:759-1475(-)
MKEGILGFYKGLSSPLAAEAGVNFLVFGTQGRVKNLIQDPETMEWSPFQAALAGSIAGFVATSLISPSECIKIRLQIQTQRKKQARSYKGPIDCLIKIIRHEGVKGLYSGTLATWIREVPAWGMYFGGYEYIRTHLQEDDGTISNSKAMFSGASAGVLSWTSIYPFDVVKTRIQKSANPGSWIQEFINVKNRSGYLGFYKGLSPTLLRALPVNSVVFLVYENVVRNPIFEYRDNDFEM